MTILDEKWTTDTGGDVTLSNGSTLLRREQPQGVSLDDSFLAAQAASRTPELLACLEDMVSKAKDAGWHHETYETAQRICENTRNGVEPD